LLLRGSRPLHPAAAAAAASACSPSQSILSPVSFGVTGRTHMRPAVSLGYYSTHTGRLPSRAISGHDGLSGGSTSGGGGGGVGGGSSGGGRKTAECPTCKRVLEPVSGNGNGGQLPPLSSLSHWATAAAAAAAIHRHCFTHLLLHAPLFSPFFVSFSFFAQRQIRPWFVPSASHSTSRPHCHRRPPPSRTVLDRLQPWRSRLSTCTW